MLIQTKNVNVGTIESVQETRHNALVTAGIQGVWEIDISGGTVATVWFKNFHDGDIFGAAPDQVVRNAFGTITPNLKEPRHGSIVSSPFITDTQIIVVAEDWSAVTEGVLGEALGIKRFIIVLDRSNGSLVHKYEIVGDSLGQEPNNGPNQFTGFGWNHDTIILAFCRLYGQHLALNWHVPES